MAGSVSGFFVGEEVAIVGDDSGLPERLVRADADFGGRAKVAGELVRQYKLGYYPNHTGASGERRNLKVEVSVPNAVVRARREVVYKLKN